MRRSFSSCVSIAGPLPRYFRIKAQLQMMSLAGNAFGMIWYFAAISITG